MVSLVWILQYVLEKDGTKPRRDILQTQNDNGYSHTFTSYCSHVLTDILPQFFLAASDIKQNSTLPVYVWQQHVCAAAC